MMVGFWPVPPVVAISRTAAIKAKYYELFRGKGRLSEEGEGEEMEGEESEEEGGEPADGGQAGSSAQHAGQWG